jgi:hypothetical protein
VLSEQALMHLVQHSPLRGELLKTAWPSLSVESKLQIIDAVGGLGALGGLGEPKLEDLALVDPAPIVRYWAARSIQFRRPFPQLREDMPPELAAQVAAFHKALEASPEESQKTARADTDECELVRAAARTAGNSLDQMVELPQLARLVTIRQHRHPNNESFARFVEAALKDGSGVSSREVLDCFSEYFSREDVWSELEDLSETLHENWLKTTGWRHLWNIAATAPTDVALTIARMAALKGRDWKIELEQLTALRDEVKAGVVGRHEEPAEQLRKVLTASPEKYSTDLMKSVKRYYDALNNCGDDGRRDPLDVMRSPNHAIFRGVEKVREEVEQLKREVSEGASKLLDLHWLTQVIFVCTVLGIGLMLYLMFRWHRS